MITCIEGVTGSGKSRYAVGRMVESLQRGRFVVTNLPIDESELRFWFQKHEQELTDRWPDIMRRVHLLADHQFADLYRWLPGGWQVGQAVGEDGEGEGKRKRRGAVDGGAELIPFGQLMHRSEAAAAVAVAHGEDGRTSALYADVFGAAGVDFFFDEAQLVFGTEGFARHGDVLLWWLTQHRKLNQNITVITQSVANIAPPFVRLCAYLVKCRNYGLQSAFGVKLPRRLKATTYTEVQSRQPFVHQTETYAVERDGLHRCYRTEQGIGMTGAGGADIGKDNRPGVPFGVGASVAVLASLLLISMGWWAVRAGGWIGQKAVKTTSQAGTAAVLGTNAAPAAVATNKPPAAPAPAAPLQARPAGPVVSVAPGVASRRLVDERDIFVTGFMTWVRTNAQGLVSRVGRITFSDGVSELVPSPRVPVIGKDYVVRQDPAGPVVIRWYVGRPGTEPWLAGVQGVQQGVNVQHPEVKR